MKNLILIIFMAATTISVKGQDRKVDEQLIDKQIDAFLTSWNKHNFDDLGNYTTDDCNWVNVVGMWWKSRKEVQFAHQAFQNGMFKNTPLTKVSTKIRFLTEDVAIVYFISKIGAYYPPDGTDRGSNKMGDDESVGTLVFVKKVGVWLITSCENVSVNAHAVRGDPVLRMK